MITAKLQAFYLGTTDTTPWTITVDLEPSAATMMTSPTILGIEKEKGVCLPTTPARLAPTSATKPEEFTVETNCSTPVKIELAWYPDKNTQLFNEVQTYTTPSTDKQSFRYRIPAQITDEVQSQDASYGKAVLSVAQLGIVGALPAKRNSKTLSYDLAFMEATGALKSFKLGTTGGLDSSTVDSLSTTTNNILDARSKARAAAKEQRQKDADAQSQLNIIKDQADILEQQDRLCTLQTKYGIPCTNKPQP